MEIRKAKLEDLSAICRIGYQLSLDMSALEPDYFAVAEQREAPMREAILQENKEIFLAEDLGEVIGFACKGGGKLSYCKKIRLSQRSGDYAQRPGQRCGRCAAGSLQGLGKGPGLGAHEAGFPDPQPGGKPSL